MHDWNVIVTVSEHGYKTAKQLLAPHGETGKTGFHNVLLLKTADPFDFLDKAQNELAKLPKFMTAVSRVMPVEKKFSFQSPDEFEYKAKQELADWIPDLANKSFHVRMHRRGFKERMRSVDEERFLDHFAIEQLKARGETATVSFEDPDVIIVVETVGNDAGIGRWDREALGRYPLLKLD